MVRVPSWLASSLGMGHLGTSSGGPCKSDCERPCSLQAGRAHTDSQPRGSHDFQGIGALGQHLRRSRRRLPLRD